MNSPANPVVRPKATHRKQRTVDMDRSVRAPSQERSRLRHDQILKAAGELLEHANIEDLSHSDIALKAGISKASVHYHFPSIAAVQLELGRIYDAECARLLSEKRVTIAQMRVPTWQELARIEAETARAYFNSHRPACETLLGPFLHRENRLAGINSNIQGGAAKLKNLCRMFDVPTSSHLEKAFQYNGEIIDLFWSGSYLMRGFIDDETLENSLRASIGFLRSFLPDSLPLRPPQTEVG